MLAAEGLSDALREAFIVYLLSHNRPMGEVVSGRVKDLAKTQHEMIDLLIGCMPDHHREFLISFERGQPDWSLLMLAQAAHLLAVRWRQHNLEKLQPEQRTHLIDLLDSSLGRRARN